MTFNITTLSIKDLTATLSIRFRFVWYPYAEFRLFNVMLSVIMLSVIILSVLILCVIMLSVIWLSVIKL
jgi:hypothetical protein